MYFDEQRDDGITDGHQIHGVLNTNLELKTRSCIKPSHVKVQVIQHIIQASSEESSQRCAEQRKQMLIDFTCFK